MVDGGEQARAFARTGVTRFTKKPVTIEAMRFETNNDDGTHLSRLTDWANGEGPVVATHDGTAIYLATLEGTMRGDVGDWIIRGVKGEIYPCKPDIFEAIYVAASRQPDGTGTPVLTRNEADGVVERSRAPRVTAVGIMAKIAGSKFFRDGVLTISIITMRNGFTFLGKSACASPENYDQAAGERYAYDDAFRQIWAFEAYLLRETLSAIAAEQRGQDSAVEASPSAAQDTRSRGEPRVPRRDERLPGGRPHP